ncbi:hypothetical protein NLJ89_g10251 [Agrocybe chaxingu]|uniref:F-box domain-containing protein n=1 Tax=Agrocybe chaxingu TaxID=84603 RepID=A0A9W8JZ27_9AGAR|nr:hypothetical protein NLJ89_g10251 [Agrocybe chaxingu]
MGRRIYPGFHVQGFRLGLASLKPTGSTGPEFMDSLHPTTTTHSDVIAHLITSPTPHLLEGNGIPSEKEITLIREAIRRAQEVLENLQREGARRAMQVLFPLGLPDMQPLMDNQSHAPDQKYKGYTLPLSMVETDMHIILTAFIDRHQALVSSILHFPPELLVEIFSWVVVESPFPTKHSGACPPELVIYTTCRSLAFSQTCAYWRQVALSAPELWTSIPFVSRIYPSDSPNANSQGYVYLVKLFLERSKELPIHVRVWLPYSFLHDGDIADAASLEPLRSVLVDAHRWITAMVYVSPDIYESLPTLDFPLLHALNLRVVLPTGPGRIIEGHYRGQHIVFQTTPRLRTLILDGRPLFPGLRNLLLPVTSFVGLPMSVEHLESSPELVKCEFRGPAGKLYMHDPPRAFRHVGIKSFRLVNTNYALPVFGALDIATFFRWIKMPNLEVLEIEGPGTIKARPVIRDLLRVTLSRPSRLRSFTFHVRDVTEIELLFLFGAMPLLEVLDIWDVPSRSLRLLLDPNRMKTGTSNVDEPFELPRLHSLIIREFSDPHFQALEQICYSRRLYADSISSSQPSPSPTPIDRDLTIFLDYRRTRECARYQNIIEGWQEVEPGKHAKGSECTMLLGWASYLIKNFLGSDRWRPDCSLKKFDFTGNGRGALLKHPWDSEKRDKFLRVVEEYEMKDGRLLEMTRLYRIMTAIRDLPEGCLLYDNIYFFRSRAGALVEKWTPLVEESAKERRWKISDDGRTLRLGDELRPRKIEVE